MPCISCADFKLAYIHVYDISLDIKVFSISIWATRVLWKCQCVKIHYKCGSREPGHFVDCDAMPRVRHHEIVCHAVECAFKGI